ncbi:hypothetical protein HYALB_00008601 [Hymenoscyphus albidus]|uniref:Signal peptide peptidase n=1 Tax=Hymenoscyphus albidus TaxID=595503 RepID=A0A9N9LEZ6_9HELO|nr:hypothetical protein HYALB_00008601 [Hymenoscyphus albidus]
MEATSSFFDGDSPLLQLLGKWAYKAYEETDLIQMHTHLILAALFPIFIGAHASLRRPPSAKAPVNEENEDGEDDGIEKEPVVEGLTPSDAIMFPVLAGITLAGLYFVIKWLKDPAILNKILTWYFSALGVFGVGKLAGDSLNVATGFFFPSVWSSGEETYHVDQMLRKQLTGNANVARIQQHRTIAGGKTNPLPGLLSNIKFSKSFTNKLWSLRAFLINKWIFRARVHGICDHKSRVRLNDVMGLVLGLTAIILYNTIGKTWWLTNLIGFGFCYGTLQLLSPTTFWTGSLVLAGLFIYDITMVFYTPLMVTVATTLDVPIKLVFPGPKRGGMLGLGDVVLPGIMMALALRFDLYLHYLRKQSSIPNKALVNDDQKPTRAVYEPSTTLWGERFWTNPPKATSEATIADGARFSKVYFKASVVGYIFGMFATLIVLNIFNHAQPALLYLVPGVLGALWGTAAYRGELTLIWNYTEDGSLDYYEPDSEQEKWEDEKKDGEKKKDEHAHHVFLFSLSEPKGKQSLGAELVLPGKKEE